MNSGRWERIKKFFALITAVLLWIVSIIFSYQGFNLDTSHSMAWVGVVMAFAITVLELIFNTNRWSDLIDTRRAFGEWMLVIGGLLAYVYDVWTNILGIYASQGQNVPSAFAIGMIVPILVGAFMAILPEPMFIWAMGFKEIPSMSTTQKIGHITQKMGHPEVTRNAVQDLFSSVGKNKSYKYETIGEYLKDKK